MKVQIKNYSFDHIARTITFSDYEAIDIDSVLYIIHVTDNRAIYNPMNKNLKGSVFGNVLTLNYDTTTMSDTDELQIYYDKIPDPATEAKQDDIITAVNAISGTTPYNFIQKDAGATYTYYGYASSTGWRIKRKTLSTGIWQVASGEGDYDTAFADRASKTYLYI